MTPLRAVTGQRGRLDRAVSDAFSELSRSRAAALIRDGHVRVDGEVVAKPAMHLPAGAVIEVDLPPPVPDEALPEDIPVHIVYEDSDVAVIDKAAGMVVHPSAGHDNGTLVNALLHHLGGLASIGGVQRPGIVHRLDKGTSGLLVVAKNDLAHGGLSAQFADHSAGRRYLALVHGEPALAGGTIESQLARHVRDRKRWASTDHHRGKLAITHWRCLAVTGSVALVTCRLETGRTHQVRVHLTELGHPLLGDPVYKRRGHTLPPALRPLVDPDRPMLHAWRLAFAHPRTGEAMAFTTPPPADFAALLEALAMGDALSGFDAEV